MGKAKKVDDVKEEIKNEEVQGELVIEDENITDEKTEENTVDEEPEVQTTFTDVAAEEMIDEEGSVENVSN